MFTIVDQDQPFDMEDVVPKNCTFLCALVVAICASTISTHAKPYSSVEYSVSDYELMHEPTALDQWLWKTMAHVFKAINLEIEIFEVRHYESRPEKKIFIVLYGDTSYLIGVNVWRDHAYSEGELVGIALHEAGHAIFYGAMQSIEDSLPSTECGGDSNEPSDTLYARFVARFWKSCDETPIYDPHEFVFDYIEHPTEDFANTFAAFVLCPDPADAQKDIRTQKILTFWKDSQALKYRDALHRSVPEHLLDAARVTFPDICARPRTS